MSAFASSAEKVEIIDTKDGNIPSRPGFPDIACGNENGVQVVVTKYAERWTIFISELGKIGTVVECSQDKGASTYTVQIRLGNREDPWIPLLGRQLIHRLTKGKIPLVLMTSLQLNGLDDSGIQEKLRMIIALVEKVVASSSSSTDGGPKQA